MPLLPDYCKSSLIDSTVSQAGQHKKDYTPYIIKPNSGKTSVTFKLARHFGFCFGVKNALSLAYSAIQNNRGKRIFLLGEIIHNPIVNKDLEQQGVRFLMDSKGHFLYPPQSLSREDIVIVPAFGTTLELQQQFSNLGIDITTYDTTCPFVKKVWDCAEKLGAEGYTVVIHGTPKHEETKSTFSHCSRVSPTIIVADKTEALELADCILYGNTGDLFKKVVSTNFDPAIHLVKIGLVNQTTMLADETEEISGILSQAIEQKYGTENLSKHFANTKHTLCYATCANQNSTLALCRDNGCDIALIVGGYNSSNTRHLAEIAQKHIKTFFIQDSEEILDAKTIRHFDLETRTVRETTNWFPNTSTPTIAISAGASCPDKVIEDVIVKCETVSR